MEISEVLSSIELSDEQTEALDKFFADFSESVKEKTEANLREAITEEIKADVEISREDAEKAFELFEADCEKAFELFESDAENAFERFEEDAEKAFNLGIADSQEEYTENMTKALQDLYEDIEVRVREDFLESQEFKALEKVKNAIAPIALSEGDKELLEEVETLKQEKMELAEEKEELGKEKIIETLMKDFPEQYGETVRKFIGQATTEDEIYERFNTIVEMIDMDPEGIKTELSEVEDVEDVEDAEEIAEEEEKEAVEESASEKKDKELYSEAIFAVTKNKEDKTDKGMSGFSAEEEDLVNLVFPQMSPQ